MLVIRYKMVQFEHGVLIQYRCLSLQHKITLFLPKTFYCKNQALLSYDHIHLIFLQFT